MSAESMYPGGIHSVLSYRMLFPKTIHLHDLRVLGLSGAVVTTISELIGRC